MARRVSDYRIHRIADRGNEEDGPDSRARGDRFYHNRRSADRGNEKVDHDPGNISEIKGLKGLRRRVRDLEIQHEIRQIRRRIRELELQREMRKEIESKTYYLGYWESCPVYDTDNEEESEVIYNTDGNDVDDSLEFELLHPNQGESLVIQRVLSVAPSKSIDDDSWRRKLKR
nr:reverse transcriptase domain-containing protein [Tanacetum cinerariifolium]